MLRAFRARFPGQFRWRERPYEFVSGKPAIDLLTGSPAVREGIDAGLSLDALAATWRPAEQEFTRRRGEWLLYD